MNPVEACKRRTISHKINKEEGGSSTWLIRPLGSWVGGLPPIITIITNTTVLHCVEWKI